MKVLSRTRLEKSWSCLSLGVGGLWILHHDRSRPGWTSPSAPVMTATLTDIHTMLLSIPCLEWNQLLWMLKFKRIQGFIFWPKFVWENLKCACCASDTLCFWMWNGWENALGLGYVSISACLSFGLVSQALVFRSSGLGQVLDLDSVVVSTTLLRCHKAVRINWIFYFF